MRIEIRVDGLPPKKDGAKSMWSKPLEAQRLIKLRENTYKALEGKAPFKYNIKISLIVHVGQTNSRLTGDLDNYITGVCDGLMAADKRSNLHPIWSAVELKDIHPSLPVAIEDDSQVMSIEAEKVVGDYEPWYRVVIEGTNT